MPAYVVVANAQAGSADDDGLDQARRQLAVAGSVEIVRLDRPHALDGVLDDLGERTLVVAGGDGTVHAAVQSLWDRGTAGAGPVGIIPLGTGNDLARCLGLPLEPGPAAAVIRTGSVRSLDLMVDDRGAVMVNAAHAGISSDAPRRASSLKPFLGRAAYPISAAYQGLRRDAVPLRVEVDGAVLAEGPTVLAAIMNGTSIGGGAPLAPGADPGDGLADVVVVRDPGRLHRLAVARSLRAGRLSDLDGVVSGRGRDVVVAGGPTPHNVDGEVGDAVGERRYRLVPGAWQVIAGAARA